MPDGLSLRTTALLVALAFAVTFGVQALLGGGSSAAKPAAKTSAAEFVADAPGAAPDLRLAAAGTVPALREPRQPRRHKRLDRKPVHKPKPAVRNPVSTAPEFTPTPTAAPPAPPHVTPAPEPSATPAPTSTPASGEFDSSGEP